MAASLFAEYVEKYFVSSLIDQFVEKYNGKKAEETYLYKTMLTEEYSPDLSWSSTSLNHSVVAADVVALDSPLPLKKRESLSRAIGRLPKLGVKYRQGEKFLSDIQVAQARGANERTIAAKILDDTKKCVRSMDVRKEIMFRRALSTGEVLTAETENDGTGIRVSFGFKDDNKFKATVAKWGEATATPMDDIQQLFDKAAEDGNVIDRVFISKKYFDLFRKSEQGKKLAANYRGITVTADKYLTVAGRSVFLEALADEFGATFEVVDGTFKVQNYDGTDTKAEAWAEGNIVAVPDRVVGRLVYGTLAEETNPVNEVSYQKAGSHVLISKYSHTDPLEEFTAAQALCLPVIDNADGIYILQADQK